MKKILLFVLTLFVFTIVSVAWHMPLTWLTSQLQLPSQLTLKGLEGKVWRGTAQEIGWQDKRIINIKWDASLYALLNRAIDAHISGKFLQGNFEGDFVINKSNLEMIDTSYENQAQNILDIQKQEFVTLSGIVNVDIQNFKYIIASKKIAALKMKAIWKNAAIELPSRIKLGEVTSISKKVGDKIITEIKGISGDIDIKGTISINENKNYAISLKLHPNVQLSEEVKLTFGLIGQEKPNGDFLINKKWTLVF